MSRSVPPVRSAVQDAHLFASESPPADAAVAVGNEDSFPRSSVAGADAEEATSPAEMTLAAIVPLYNEAGTVAELLVRLEAVTFPAATSPQLDGSAAAGASSASVGRLLDQIVIVDDGSTDGSDAVVKEWMASLPPERASQVRLVQHEVNRGKGRAIRTGLEHVTTTHVVIQDADLEYDPADIARLWDVMQSGHADVVYGSRYLDKPQLQKGRWIMQSGVRFLNLLVRLLYGVKLTDEACCYKMFRTQDLRAMNLQCERFEFCPEVTAKAAKRDLSIREVPVGYESRTEGKKLRWRDGWAAAITVIGFRTGG